LLEHLLDNFLLLNEESTNNPLADADCAAGATIGAGNRLLVLSDAPEPHWALLLREPLESGATVATFGRGRCLLDLVEGEHTTWSLDLANLVGLGGVRMTTTVLETLNHDKLQHSYN